MKFAEHLQAHLTPEWRTQYVDYDELKDFCYKCLDEAATKTNEDDRLAFFVDKDEEFYVLCETELNKIDDFFGEKVAEAKRKLKDLEWELKEYKVQAAEKKFMQSRLTMELPTDPAPTKQTETFSKAIIPGSVLRRREERKKKRKRVRKMQDIKLAYQEYYLNLILLQNYQTLNFTGFRKILKKHDKLFGLSSGYQWRVRNVESARFHTSKEVTEFINRVEQTYITDLEMGDRHAAMKRLRVPPLAEQENPWTTFLVGFFFGIFLVQLVTIVLAVIYLGNTVSPWEPGLRLYRSTFLVPLFLLYLGLNTYGWRTSGVNHVLIFEIDPRDHLNHTEIMQISGVFAVAWAASLQMFLFSSWLNGFPTYAAPLFICLFMPVYLFNPLPLLQCKSRRWLRRVLFRIFTAPLHPVTFADFWLADQLNSLAILFVDFEFFLCFYASQMEWIGFTPLAAASTAATNATMSAAETGSRGGVCSGLVFGLTPLFKCLPAWFRFAQCIRRYYDMKERHAFPHLVNAGKYSMTFFVTISAVLFQVTNSEGALAAYVILSLLATAYCYAWDILMDWGLLDRPREGQFLRDELVYNRTWVYYAAMVEDLLLRLTWAFSIGLKFQTAINQQVYASVIAVLEVTRRFVWNFFRLENEHLNNCGQFRAVRDIYIQPVRPKPVDDSGDPVDAGTEPVPCAPKRYAPYLYRTSQERLNQSQLLRSVQSLFGGAGGRTRVESGGISGGGGGGGQEAEPLTQQREPGAHHPAFAHSNSHSSGHGHAHGHGHGHHGGGGGGGHPGNLSKADAFPIGGDENGSLEDEFNA